MVIGQVTFAAVDLNFGFDLFFTSSVDVQKSK